jgi:hypothetical protein
MTDERLLPRLRGRGNKDTTAAADRIEALTAKVKLMDDLDVINGEKIEALTAKLAKAVELLKEARQDLEEYVTHEWPKDEHPVYERKWERDMELCRRIDAMLAEIEGKEP